MLCNYHTHTARCFHAEGADEAYVTTAIENGFSVLGFSDHTPWPYESGYVSENERMSIDRFPEYLSSIERLKEKYADKITILTGLECEYFPQFFDWLREVKPQLDYLILGNHFELTDENGGTYYGKSTTPDRIESYTKYTLLGMQTGLFSYLAHPELPFADYPVFDDACRDCAHALCREAKALDLPIEYNMYGVLKRKRGIFKGLGYPANEFWEIAAEYKNRTIIGVDAHKPEHLAETENFRVAKEYLLSLGLPVIEEI